MNNELDILACPRCRSDLERRDNSLICPGCGAEYPPADGGIYSLFSPNDSLTTDVDRIAVKSAEEAAATIAEMRAIDCGFIRQPRMFYLLYAAIALALFMGRTTGAMLMTALLFVDWIVFRARRASALARYRNNPLRLVSVTDHAAIDSVFEASGRSQPTMSDWVSLSGGSDAENRFDAERYADVRRIYDRVAPEKAVVLDVGANDGAATAEHGIGSGATVVGVEVSAQLLQLFNNRVEGGIAVQADGGRLPIKDNVVDFLVCTETLEHVNDPKAAVTEFLRVLRPGGHMVIQSPNAHRVRNLNPFHLLTLVLSVVSDAVLQKKTVHENTWHTAVTFHWDFSIQDYQRMVTAGNVIVHDLSSREFWCPRFLIGDDIDRYRAKERFLKNVPVIRYLGGDLTMHVEKQP